ncbi:alpha/beta hydrolase [Algoriphagus boritolerans]|uniref:alpha/beta fold hydrolase n=1 Tax=Algoriphagus boritolerans TaxID=308111 RepID=UPI000A3DC1B3
MKKLFLLYFILFGGLSTAFTQGLDVQVSGEGPKIILIPGLASSGEVWDETVAQLSKNFECHVLTLPGFGGNPKVEMPEGFLGAMESLITNYINEQTEKVTLIGHSVGGFISLRLSRSIPDKINRAIIVDSYPFYSAAFNPAATAENMVAMASQMKELMIAQSPEQFRAQQEISMPVMTTNQEKLPTAVNWSLESDRETTAQALFELMTTDYRDELAEVSTPILVLGAWHSGKAYGWTEESVKKNL